MRRSVGRRDFLSSVAAGDHFRNCILRQHFHSIGGICGRREEIRRMESRCCRTVITPETSVWLAGYGSKRPPDGKLHDLWMKALALEDNSGQRAVLITSDFQGVPR